MVNPSPVTIALSTSDTHLCERFARESSMGGRSQVRPDRAERLATLNTDQLVGHLGNLAGCMWLYGKALGHYIFRTTQHDFGHRWDGRVGRGDGGSDIIGSNIDFKSCEWSLVGARPLTEVFLPVRPHERHEQWLYVLVLVEPKKDAAHIVGWARDEEITGAPNGTGVFEGAHVIRVPDLHEPLPLRWTL